MNVKLKVPLTLQGFADLAVLFIVVSFSVSSIVLTLEQASDEATQIQQSIAVILGFITPMLLIILIPNTSVAARIKASSSIFTPGSEVGISAALVQKFWPAVLPGKLFKVFCEV